LPRHIRLIEPGSGLDCRLVLLDERAPRSAQALWARAGAGGEHEAIHAMWTGPEISCPVPATAFPAGADLSGLPLENATSFPEAGDVAVVWAPANSFKGQPSAFFDVGLFYGPGARLFMPMGWVMASVCAQVADDDVEAYRAGCMAIRRAGACRLTFSQGA
jgi:TPR repeat protein